VEENRTQKNGAPHFPSEITSRGIQFEKWTNKETEKGQRKIAEPPTDVSQSRNKTVIAPTNQTQTTKKMMRLYLVLIANS